MYHQPYGGVRSPEYPSDYPASAECEWEVRAEPGFRLRLSFTGTFDMETSDQCQNDFVQVRRRTTSAGQVRTASCMLERRHQARVRTVAVKSEQTDSLTRGC